MLTPKRRPLGKNHALHIFPPIEVFSASNLTNGINRPTRNANAWVADFSEEQSVVDLTWKTLQTIFHIEIEFDTDFDHPMESVLMRHPERNMPFCVSTLKIYNADQREHELLAEILFNHQSRRSVRLGKPCHHPPPGNPDQPAIRSHSRRTFCHPLLRMIFKKRGA